MAKQRPTLGTFAQPTSTFVAPVDAQKTVTPLDQKAIRDTYAFAESFGELSQSMVKVASTIKSDMNAESFQEGIRKVNESRKTFKDLVVSGQIAPHENPWLTVGAQKASGVLEASQAELQIRDEYNRAIANNPELLKDNMFFDSLVSSFVQNKKAQIGDMGYLSDSFFETFNPSMLKLASENAANVGKYKQQKIVDSMKVQVNEVLKGIPSKFPEKRPFGGGIKDEGFLGPMYDLQGNVVTERSVTFDTGTKDEFTVPMIVPGLSQSGLEAIVYNNAPFDSLSQEDQTTIIEHAKKRIADGKSPFYGPDDRINDNLVPALQQYMDEQGQNLGYPRIANIAVASYLIEAMKSSGQTYDAEKILRALKTGTGNLADTSEVKAMLVDAGDDIAKNRLGIATANEKDYLTAFTAQAYADVERASYEKSSDNVESKWEDQFAAQVAPNLKYLSFEDQAKALDHLRSQMAEARRAGTSKVGLADISNVEQRTQKAIEDAAGGGIIPDWGFVANATNEAIRSRGISGEQVKTAKDAAKRVVVKKLESLRFAMFNDLNRRFGRNSIASFDPEPGDTNDIRSAKAAARIDYRLNVLQAAIHFDMEDQVEDIRRIAINGISVDVENGVRPELSDLIYMFNNSANGRSDVTALLDKGERGKRTLKFLENVRIKMQSQISLPDAVRDAAQELNMGTAGTPMDLVDLGVGSKEMTDVREAITEVLESTRDSYYPMIWDYNFNQDSQNAVGALFKKAYVENMNRTNGAHRASIDYATQYVHDNILITGDNLYDGTASILPKKPFENAGVDKSYIQAFTNVELNDLRASLGAKFGEDIKASLVWVADGADGQPLFAFRDKEGRSLKDKYYTMNDIVGRERPRDAQGNIIEGGLSIREKVVGELNRKAKRKSAETKLNVESARSYSIF